MESPNSHIPVELELEPEPEADTLVLAGEKLEEDEDEYESTSINSNWKTIFSSLFSGNTYDASACMSCVKGASPTVMRFGYPFFLCVCLYVYMFIRTQRVRRLLVCYGSLI